MTVQIICGIVALLVVCGQLGASPIGSEVQPGPNTYTLLNESGESNVIVREQPSGRYLSKGFGEVHSTSGPVPARDFSIGTLTPRSKFDFASVFNYTGLPDRNVSTVMESNNYLNYTFVEVFDLSADGQSGGNVELLAGNVGKNFFKLGLSSSAINLGLKLQIVAYAEDEQYGGQNFLLGRYVPGLTIFSSRNIHVKAKANEVVRYEYVYQARGEIGFIQGTDYVKRGTGGLVSYAGGVGSTNVTLHLESGVGEDLSFNVLIYGTKRV